MISDAAGTGGTALVARTSEAFLERGFLREFAAGSLILSLDFTPDLVPVVSRLFSASAELGGASVSSDGVTV